MNRSSSELIREELERKSKIFKDEGKLSIDYVPKKLVHRERELRLLTAFFKPVINDYRRFSQRVVISGPVGVGKTAIARRFGQDIVDLAAEKGVKLNYIHINCRKERTSFQVVSRVLREFMPSLPKRGLSLQELLHILADSLKETDAHLILTLDEVDMLIKNSGPELLYDLTRLFEEDVEHEHRLSLILIMKEPHIVRSLLEPGIDSTLMHNEIRLNRYNEQQLFDILKARVTEEGAFYEGVVSDKVLKMIASIASNKGDARYAIEILWRAGKYADLEEKDEVLPEHVRRAIADTIAEVSEEDLMVLSKQEKLVLLTISRLLRSNPERVYITMGELEEAYKTVSEEYNEKPRSHTQLWEYVRSLEIYGFIDTRKSGKGIKGQTTLISLPRIPAELLEKRLIAVLEREKA